MPNVMCGCECWRHFSNSPNGDHLRDDADRISHAYMSVPAGDTRAAYVGNVCDECAKHLPPQYIIGKFPL
jgi:hypothetical protein